ncbi:MAG: hypothetical protein IT385_02465 [Deltaproteobacteria bacterium]|nr:hypothetical protein [Deltaproteobacteria bacterium]
MRHLVLALVLTSACSKAPPAADTAAPKPTETKPAETPPPETKPAETPPPETKPAETPPPAAAGSREATCTDLAGKTSEVLASLTKEVDALGLAEKPNLESPKLGECVTDPSGKGAWIMTLDKGTAKLEKAAAGEEGAEYNVERLIAFVFVAEDGTTQRFEPEPDGDAEGFNVHVDQLFAHNVGVARAFDWDDDGLVDLAIRDHYRGPDVDNTSFDLVRVHEGKAEAWAVTGDAKVIEIRDADEDGRPDLLTLAPFAWGIRGDSVPGTVRHLHRSVKGGFSTDDDGVKAYYKKACGGAKVELGAAPKSDQEGDVMDQLVCARLWGASVKDVQAKLDAFMKKAYEAEPHPMDDPENPPYLSKVPVTLE